MKTEVRNEFILEAHKSACNEWKLKIEKECPELFENKLEVGKWYKDTYNRLFFITTIIDKENCDGYGFGYGGAFFVIKDMRFSWKINGKEIEATEEEVKEALIKEAKKRGIDKQGNTLFCLQQQRNIFNNINEDAVFYYSFNMMYYNGICVYKNGEFSKVFSNPIEEKIKKYERKIEKLKKQL